MLAVAESCFFHTGSGSHTESKLSEYFVFPLNPPRLCYKWRIRNLSWCVDCTFNLFGPNILFFFLPSTRETPKKKRIRLLNSNRGFSVTHLEKLVTVWKLCFNVCAALPSLLCCCFSCQTAPQLKPCALYSSSASIRQVNCSKWFQIFAVFFFWMSSISDGTGCAD